MLIVYFFRQDSIIITANTQTERIFEISIPEKLLLSLRYFTMDTLEKLISIELLLNLIPAKIAQKMHTPIMHNIKLTNALWRRIGSTKEYENRIGNFIKYVY